MDKIYNLVKTTYVSGDIKFFIRETNVALPFNIIEAESEKEALAKFDAYKQGLVASEVVIKTIH